MSNQHTLVHTIQIKQKKSLKPYSKPQVVVLGKANELTLAVEVAPNCDIVLHGDDPCAS